jgi:hypothetical protein
MITDLDRLSDALDNSTLSRQLVSTVTRQKDRIAKAIAENGSAIVSVGGRRYRVAASSKGKSTNK